MVYFKSADKFRKGNAVIAARDAGGTILWSWHIWMTDRPQDQEYLNGAGTMMDRDLGATSATPETGGFLGLLYQWGRKDPFPGSSSLEESIQTKTTAEWPDPVKSDESTGTIDYSIANPLTFITCNDSNSDWYYTGNNTVDNTRWKSVKTIYDPCPSGYRVPDGGKEGIWAKAFGSSNSFNAWNNSGKSYNFGSSGKIDYKLTGSNQCWYFTTGSLNGSGVLEKTGEEGIYWSCSAETGQIYAFTLTEVSTIRPAAKSGRYYANPVRCIKEK